MKVIKPGDPKKKEPWSKQYTCTGKGNGGGGCGAVLLLEEGDLYHTYSHCKDESDTFTTFTCPECNKKTDIAYPGVKVHLSEDIWKLYQDHKRIRAESGDK